MVGPNTLPLTNRALETRCPERETAAGPLADERPGVSGTRET